MEFGASRYGFTVQLLKPDCDAVTDVSGPPLRVRREPLARLRTSDCRASHCCGVVFEARSCRG
jgi:hypothetical protein